MQNIANINDFELVQNVFNGFANPIESSNNQKLMKVMVDSSKPTYQFKFEPKELNGTIFIYEVPYRFVIAKSDYGQIIAMIIDPVTNKSHQAKLDTLADALQKVGSGLVNSQPKKLVPKLNTALEFSNFKISNNYWKSQLDYAKQTMLLSLNNNDYFEINWQYGFYTNIYKYQNTKFFINKNEPELQLPLSLLLEVSKTEYLRITNSINQLNNPTIQTNIDDEQINESNNEVNDDNAAKDEKNEN